MATKPTHKNIWIKKDKQVTKGNDSNVSKEIQVNDQYGKETSQGLLEIKSIDKGKNIDMYMGMMENDQYGKDTSQGSIDFNFTDKGKYVVRDM